MPEKNPDSNPKVRRAIEIDRICDEFEAAMQEGKRLELRAELEKIDSEARPELFQHLLGIQQSILMGRGEKPELTELLIKFPEFTRQILEVYGEDSSLVETLPVDGTGEGDLDEILREIQPERRYEVGDEVARGGMGSIRLAEDQALRRRLVVKTMLDPQSKANEVARFIEDAQITGQLDHPGIVPVHELGVDESGKPYYSMKFVHGRDLNTLLSGLRAGDAGIRREFPLHQLLTIFDRVCDAVAFAHAHGVIHRDLKPANIRVGEFGEVMVMDWGLAKVIGRDDRPMETRQVSSIREEEDSGAYHTVAGSVMGSPQYMSPEQARGETATLDERSDIYALGAILYEILTAQPAIEADRDIFRVLESVTAGNIRHPTLFNRVAAMERQERLAHCPGHRIPEALAKVAMKALSLDREDRYEKVTDLQREVESWMGGFATEAENAGLFRQVRLFVRRNKIASAAAGILALVLAGATALSLYQRGIAVEARGEAETALASFQESERQKAAQAKASAPAYLKSALALEQQGDFENALTTAEGALAFDSDLTEGHRVRSLLLARDERWDEALDAARDLSTETDLELRRLLEAILKEPEKNRLPELAQVATQAGMPSTATDLLARSETNYHDRYAEALPVWREKLSQAWGFKVGWNELKIDKNGLFLALGADQKSKQVNSLEAVRGIPLEKISLRGLTSLESLEPLRGMPLTWVKLYQLPRIDSIEPLKDAPLRHFEINGISNSAKNLLEALRGKRLEHLELDLPSLQIDTSPLSEIQCRSLLIYAQASSLKFLSDQEDLRSLTVGRVVGDRDWRPVLECPTLEIANWASHINAITVVTVPIWDRIGEGDFSGAKSLIGDLRGSIRNSACNPTREMLDMLEFFIDRKMNGHADRSDYETLASLSRSGLAYADGEENRRIVELDDGRAAYIFVLRPQEDGWRNMFVEAFAKLEVQLASIRSSEEEALVRSLCYAQGGIITGGFRLRDDPRWQWRDGSPWHYENFAKGEKDKEFQTAGQKYVLGGSGQAVSANWWNFPIDRMLIQFPAEWLETGKTTKGPAE